MFDLVKRRWALLLVISVLILLAHVIILLCVLWVRKRFHRSSPADDSGVPPSNRLKGSQSNEVILNFKNEARVEPASDSTPEWRLKPSPTDQEDDENVLERRWKTIYETSRVLYTIEEESEEETASYGSRTSIKEEGGQQGGSDVVLDVV